VLEGHVDGNPVPFQASTIRFRLTRAAIWSTTSSVEFFPQTMIDHRCPTIATPQGTVRQPVFDGMGSAVTTVGICEPRLGRVQVQVAAIGICEARKQAI
jgi:hypothetical protein